MKAALQMGTAETIAQPDTHRAVFGASPEILTHIYRDDIHMAVWQRRTAAQLITESQLRADRSFTNYRSALSIAKLQNLEEILPNHAIYSALSADILLLADMFSCLFELKSVGLRLTALTEAMCPKFHVDKVPCRLITTYVGTGTQWLPHHSVDRSKLGAGSGGLEDAKSGLYPTAQAIETLASGDVALLKGESWQSNEGAGLVHRSPSVEPGRKRLLLTLDFSSTSGTVIAPHQTQAHQ